MEPQSKTSMEGAIKVTEKVLSASQDLKESVKTRLAEQNPEIKEAVVNKLVKEEKDKRTSLLEKAFDELSRLEGEFKKIQPDIFAADGKTDSQPFYSAEVLKKRNDLSDKIKKLEGALTKAISEKDWSPLKDLMGNLKQPPQTGEGSK